MIASQRSTSRKQALPPSVFVTLGAGQPKLMSTISAPHSRTSFAACAMMAGSLPHSCVDTGRSTPC
jgi:hypothetical protein